MSEVKLKKRVLVYGDVMIDRYTQVTTARQAQEAPIPVWDLLCERQELGGAANVAANVASLGGDDVEVFLLGSYGDDVCDLLSSKGLAGQITTWMYPTETMVKHRYVEFEGKIIFRVDSRRLLPVARFAEIFGDRQRFDALVVSDYDKGTVDPDVRAVSFDFPLRIVDSKRKDLSLYTGFDLMKLNDDEYVAQYQGYNGMPVESLVNHVVRTRGRWGAELSFLSQDGMVWREEFPVRKVWAKDITGAGDVHTAAMCVEMLRSGDVRRAVKFANEAARLSVTRLGTTAVHRRELEEEMKKR